MTVSEPATKQDLDEAMGVLRGEMTGMETRLRGEMDQIRGEMKATTAELRDEMKATKTELLLEIGAAITRATNVMTEHFSRHFGALDDKLGAQAQRHDELRTDFNSHKADVSLHVRPPAAPARRARRRPSR
jgi:hypothetical protein